MKNAVKPLCIILASIVSIAITGYVRILFDGKLHADVVFDEQGRVIETSGIHSSMFSMYNKNGTWAGAVTGADLCEQYHTSDVEGAAEKFATSHGYIYVPSSALGDPIAYIEQRTSTKSTEAPVAEQPAQEAETKPEAKAEEKPKYEHGIYDGITEDALNAFDYFTADGVADSCYIQIKENAELRTMPGSHISKTAANSEYGEVQFVNENEEVVYKFVFPQVKADADFSMELTPTIEDVDEGIKVDFKDEKLYNMDLGFEVDFFFQTGKPGTKYYVYTSEADGLHEYNTITTDADGFARLPYTMVQDYTFSETDLVAAAEEAKAKAQAEAEAKRLEEEAKKAAEEQANAPAEEPVVNEEPVEPIVIEDKSNAPYVLVGVIAVALIGIGVIIVRKFRK